MPRRSRKNKNVAGLQIRVKSSQSKPFNLSEFLHMINQKEGVSTTYLQNGGVKWGRLLPVVASLSLLLNFVAAAETDVDIPSRQDVFPMRDVAFALVDTFQNFVSEHNVIENAVNVLAVGQVAAAASNVLRNIDFKEAARGAAVSVLSSLFNAVVDTEGVDIFRLADLPVNAKTITIDVKAADGSNVSAFMEQSQIVPVVKDISSKINETLKNETYNFTSLTAVFNSNSYETEPSIEIVTFMHKRDFAYDSRVKINNTEFSINDFNDEDCWIPRNDSTLQSNGTYTIVFPEGPNASNIGNAVVQKLVDITQEATLIAENATRPEIDAIFNQVSPENVTLIEKTLNDNTSLQKISPILVDKSNVNLSIPVAVAIVTEVLRENNKQRDSPEESISPNVDVAQNLTKNFVQILITNAVSAVIETVNKEETESLRRQRQRQSSSEKFKKKGERKTKRNAQRANAEKNLIPVLTNEEIAKWEHDNKNSYDEDYVKYVILRFYPKIKNIINSLYPNNAAVFSDPKKTKIYTKILDAAKKCQQPVFFLLHEIELQLNTLYPDPDNDATSFTKQEFNTCVERASSNCFRFKGRKISPIKAQNVASERSGSPLLPPNSARISPSRSSSDSLTDFVLPEEKVIELSEPRAASIPQQIASNVAAEMQIPRQSSNYHSASEALAASVPQQIANQEAAERQRLSQQIEPLASEQARRANAEKSLAIFLTNEELKEMAEYENENKNKYNVLEISVTHYHDEINKIITLWSHNDKKKLYTKILDAAKKCKQPAVFLLREIELQLKTLYPNKDASSFTKQEFNTCVEKALSNCFHLNGIKVLAPSLIKSQNVASEGSGLQQVEDLPITNLFSRSSRDSSKTIRNLPDNTGETVIHSPKLATSRDEPRDAKSNGPARIVSHPSGHINKRIFPPKQTTIKSRHSLPSPRRTSNLLTTKTIKSAPEAKINKSSKKIYPLGQATNEDFARVTENRAASGLQETHAVTTLPPAAAESLKVELLHGVNPPENLSPSKKTREPLASGPAQPFAAPFAPANYTPPIEATNARVTETRAASGENVLPGQKSKQASPSQQLAETRAASGQQQTHAAQTPPPAAPAQPTAAPRPASRRTSTPPPAALSQPAAAAGPASSNPSQIEKSRTPLNYELSWDDPTKSAPKFLKKKTANTVLFDYLTKELRSKDASYIQNDLVNRKKNLNVQKDEETYIYVSQYITETLPKLRENLDRFFPTRAEQGHGTQENYKTNETKKAKIYKSIVFAANKCSQPIHYILQAIESNLHLWSNTSANKWTKTKFDVILQDTLQHCAQVGNVKIQSKLMDSRKNAEQIFKSNPFFETQEDYITALVKKDLAKSNKNNLNYISEYITQSHKKIRSIIDYLYPTKGTSIQQSALTSNTLNKTKLYHKILKAAEQCDQPIDLILYEIELQLDTLFPGKDATTFTIEEFHICVENALHNCFRLKGKKIAGQAWELAREQNLGVQTTYMSNKGLIIIFKDKKKDTITINFVDEEDKPPLDLYQGQCYIYNGKGDDSEGRFKRKILNFKSNDGIEVLGMYYTDYDDETQTWSAKDEYFDFSADPVETKHIFSNIRKIGHCPVVPKLITGGRRRICTKRAGLKRAKPTRRTRRSLCQRRSLSKRRSSGGQRKKSRILKKRRGALKVTRRRCA